MRCPRDRNFEIGFSLALTALVEVAAQTGYPAPTSTSAARSCPVRSFAPALDR